MNVWLLLLVGCEGPVQPSASPPAPAPAPTPVAAPAPAAAVAPAPEPKRLAKVLEVLATSQYSVLRMEACGQEAWVAGPKAEFTVGQTLEMPMGTPMENFEAKELKRTFEQILFVSSLAPSTAEIECPKPRHGAGPAPEGPPPKATLVGTVKETMESGGYRYARLDVCGKEAWVAGPKVPLKVGETLVGRGGMEMTNFTSPTLGRTFPSIQFLTKIAVDPKPPECK